MRFRLRPVEILTRYERRTVQGRLEPIDHCHANGRNRRSAEARDSTDELPLTVRERLFVLRPPDGKVCPFWDIRDRTVERRGRVVCRPFLPGGRMLVLVKRSSPPEAMTGLPLVAQGAEVYRRP